ncbi:MAG: hypothetical protein WBG50_23920 [Desulfomonilaceae bacterium]
MKPATGLQDKQAATGKHRLPGFSDRSAIIGTCFEAKRQQLLNRFEGLEGTGTWHCLTRAPEKAFALNQRKGIKYRLAHFLGRIRKKGRLCDASSWATGSIDHDRESTKSDDGACCEAVLRAR